jgi:hypothetical protein
MHWTLGIWRNSKFLRLILFQWTVRRPHRVTQTVAVIHDEKPFQDGKAFQTYAQLFGGCNFQILCAFTILSISTLFSFSKGEESLLCSSCLLYLHI